MKHMIDQYEAISSPRAPALPIGEVGESPRVCDEDDTAISAAAASEKEEDQMLTDLSSLDAKDAESIKKLQARARGVLGRKAVAEVKLQKEEVKKNDAATLLQARAKGMMARKEVSNKKANMEGASTETPEATVSAS